MRKSMNIKKIKKNLTTIVFCPPLSCLSIDVSVDLLVKLTYIIEKNKKKAITQKEGHHAEQRIVEGVRRNARAEYQD